MSCTERIEVRMPSSLITYRTGDPLGWEGIVQVDGISYEWMGIGSQSLPKIPQLTTAEPNAVSYDSQYSNFTFTAGPIN